MRRRRRRAHQARLVAQRSGAALRRHAAASGDAGARAAGRSRSASSTQHLAEIIDGMEMDLQPDPLSRFRRRWSSTATASPASSACSPPRSSATATQRTLEYAARPRPRVPAHQHHPRRRRGRAQGPHLPAAWTNCSSSASRRRHPAARARPTLRAPDGVPDRARASATTTRRSRCCRRRTASAQRPGLVMAAIYRTLLDEIGADGCRVLHQRTALTPMRKLWIAWQDLGRGVTHARRRRRRRLGRPGRGGRSSPRPATGRTCSKRARTSAAARARCDTRRHRRSTTASTS